MSARQGDKSGSGEGQVLTPGATHRPKGRGRRPVQSPRPRQFAPGRGQLLGAVPIHPRSCWRRACGWILFVWFFFGGGGEGDNDGGGGLNPGHPSAKSMTASKKKNK